MKSRLITKTSSISKTTQVKWTADKMVCEVTRLWLHTTTYSKKDKYKSRCTIKKRLGGYKREQQGHQIAQGQVIDKKSEYRSRSGYD